MPRIIRVVALAAFGALLALAPAGAATASTAPAANLNDFAFESFHSDFTLTRDPDGHARLDVVETIVAVFPNFDQNRGFYRDIPEYRHGVQLHTEVTSVVDETGQPVPYETEYYEDFYSVALGDDSFVQGRQTYVITYSQVDVVEAFADTNADEFYWDVNGTGWAQPFGRVSMTATIGPELTSELTGNADCFVFGPCDEPITATATADGGTVFTAASNDLEPNESLTFAIGFTTGTFEPGEEVIPPPSEECCEPSPPQPAFWTTVAPVVLGPVGLLISWIASGTQVADRSRRTPASDIIIPQYTPPKDLNVMVAAYISGASERAFSAQIVDLAVRGNVRLLDHPSDSAAPFEVQLLHADGLDDLETKLLRAIFGKGLEPGRRIPLGSSNRTLGTKLTDVYKSVDKKLKGDGLQGPVRPTVLWTALFTLSIIIAIVAGIFALAAVAMDGDPVLPFIAAAVALYSASATYGRRSTVATLSARGKDQNDYLLGMRDYMKLAEEDRIRVLQSPEGAERVNVDDNTAMVKLYERLLPYAVIFGIEDEWSQELTVKAVAAQVPVTWWTGESDFSAWRLHSTIQRLRLATPEPPRPIVARTKSSSSGGGWGGWGSGGSSGGWSGSSGSSFSGGSFGGGGFSGGGGGGGGGRGR